MTVPLHQPAPRRGRFALAVLAWFTVFALAGWMIWQGWWVLAIIVVALGALVIAVAFWGRHETTKPDPDPEHHLRDGSAPDYYPTRGF